ncbi:NitT/TauT family transport system substrate-binding protein [Actinokineospora alba]|uniref:NitT/TauT family transport system substrate-binding protein n=1 Tax=Actinokineospora alba TaxID=504798 RepID=A0A1H0SCP5_9PSEU|nr:NitT/TauT family transport system substrate-binding protein [Actinokineospora alba]SDI53108.1 NitT/TauT family transport system substrate-binding protein [Actinokineospora alba]SDP39457.1 NitT/TauT family transport system substrate-binding protein [Actinokineospora alba]
MLRSVTTRRFSRARLPIAAVAVALLASGCSLLGGESGSDGAQQGPGGVEKAKIKVGVLPVVDVAPFYRAIEQGYFKEQGLEVEAQVMASGPASITGVINGDVDIAFASYPAPLLAQSKKLAEFKIVADALSAKPGHLVVVTLKDSAFKKPSDAPGKRIAITGRNSFTDLAPMSVLKNQGVDYNQVKWIEMPLPEMMGALQKGDVDAAVMVEPWVTNAMKKIGAVPVFDGASGPTAEIPMSGYVAIGGQGKFASTSPNTIAAFQRALAKAHAEATDRSKMEPMFVKYAKIDQQTAQLVTISTYSTSLEANRIQRVANLMEEFGVIKGHLDVKTMIPNGSAGK